jgi:hypothetical protein
VITYAIGLLLAVAQASSRDSLRAEGVRLAPMQPAAALVRFDAILALDSTDLEANWRAAIALNDMAEPLRDAASRGRRNALLAQAQEDARRAVRHDSTNGRALFALGVVLGNTALSRGLKERVRMAVEIHALALRAVAADSSLDGPHHLLGRWNYEVMKLSGFERFVARNLLGGGVLGRASWDAARRHLEQSVELDSTRIYHRLDLARVYLARKDAAASRSQLETIRGLPDRVAADSSYRREAADLLRQLPAPKP